MRKIIAVCTTALVALGLLAVGFVAPASAHTGDLSVTAVCNPVTGEYDFTAKLTISQTNLPGDTNFRVGNSNFEGTPNSANNMPGGIAVNGSGVYDLTSFSLAGTTTGYGPWVYAYTKFSDKFAIGSDGQLLQPLAGDCVKVPDADAKADFGLSVPTCSVASVLTYGDAKFATFSGTPSGTVGPAPYSITITADAGHVLASNGQKTETFTGTISGADGSLCPTVTNCPAITQGDPFTNLNTGPANFSETRATGHYEFTAAGLHIWTEGATSTDKVAFYTNAYLPSSWAALGEPSIAYTGTGGATPGFQLGADRDGNGTWDGYVVREPAYTPGYWWSNKVFGVPAGAGYPSFAPLGGPNSYLSNNPNIAPTNYGFSLGSGVKGDFVVQSLTIGCVEHPFQYVAPPADGNTVTETTDCTTELVTITTTPYTYVISGGAWVKVDGTPIVTTRAATAAELNAANCPPPVVPDPKTRTTVTEKADCDSDTVAITTTLFTTKYVYDSTTRTYSLGAEDAGVVTKSTRPATALDKADCVVAEVLAYTGSNPATPFALGAWLVVIVGLSLLGVSRIRKARTN